MAIAQPSTQPTATREDWTDYPHTGPGTLAGRYLRSFWQPIYLSRNLAPGRAVPIKVMGEDFTLYRGETRRDAGDERQEGAGDGPHPHPLPAGEGAGAAHLVAFRCAHRGTQLSTGWVEGDEIRCFYHGWKYDGSGQCTEQPAEPEPFCSRIKIKAYPVREYLGMIFAYLGEGEPPAMWSFPEFERPGHFRIRRQIWPCNYFQRVENSLDHVHGAFVHRERTNDYGLGEVPKIVGYETEYGIKEIGIRKGHVRMQHFHMPNINYRPPWAAPKGNDLPETAPDPEGGAAANLVWRVPQDDGAVISFLLDHLSPEAVAREAANRHDDTAPADHKGYVGFRDAADAVLRGETSVEALRGITNMTNVEDYVAQVGQGTVADRSDERLGRSDVLVLLLRTLWSRELRNLAEGKPLKQWRRLAPEAYELSRTLAEGEEPEELLAPVAAPAMASHRQGTGR